jgi:hypothetical protein
MLVPISFDYLGLPLGLKQLIEHALKETRFRKRPKRLILVAENNVLEDGLGNTQQHRDLLLNLGAMVVYLEHFSIRILCLDYLLY